MNLYRYISRLLVILFVAISVVACSDEDCPINNTVMGKMVFYNQLGDVVSINASLSVNVVRPQGDSVVLNQKTLASDVIFPLSYTHETDTFIFCYDFNGSVILYDSLYVSHVNIPTLVSVNCGTAMFHDITSVSSTHYLIDTLILKSSEVNYDERENIQVIYHSTN